MGSLASDDCYGHVIDIGGSAMQSNIGEKLRRILKQTYNPRNKPTLPDELLYDDIGMPIWNEIIFTPEFYQTHDEMALLDTHGDDIAGRVQPGVTLIDIGAGDTRKVERLLNAFEETNKIATYLALDISKASLKHNISYLSRRHSSADAKVTCAGIWGTFQDGQMFANRIHGPKLFLSLGSVLCNDQWVSAVEHLKSWKAVMRSGDMMLVGMDAHLAYNQRDKLWKAYHTREDLYRQFFLNGFDHANRLVGHRWFREEDWEFCAEIEEEPTTRHRFYFVAKRCIEYEGMERAIAQGEEFDWFDSHKYDEQNVQIMCSKAGLRVIDIWAAPGSEFRQYLIEVKDSNELQEDSDSGVSGVS